ncbi:SIR2-like domain-containing protein [Variovorax sp. OK605]|nr:SIR2-like domain-containing protein [Variovorax sp. OK605]
MGIGLPSWDELLEALFKSTSLTRGKNQTNEIAAEEVLRNGFSGDRIKFAEAIRKALYEIVNSDPTSIDRSPLMGALGAMVMSSSRGKVSNVITFNFDNLLEEYLESRGFVVRSVDMLPSWSDYGDVTVLHPHGLLPRDFGVDLQRGVIFTQYDYANIIGQEKLLWRQRVSDIFRSNTCLFIGLSGTDMNLMSMIQPIKAEHSSMPDHFWGIRLAGPTDSLGSYWEDRGVVSHKVGSYADIPLLLLEICKRAAKLRAVG